MPPGFTERGITVSFFLPSLLSSFLKYNKQWRWQRATGIWIWRGWGWWRGGGRGFQAFWWEWKWNGDRNSGLCVNSVSSLVTVGQNRLCSWSWLLRVQPPCPGCGKAELAWRCWRSLCTDCSACWWVIPDVREPVPTLSELLANNPSSQLNKLPRVSPESKPAGNTPEKRWSCIPKSLHVWEVHLGQVGGHVENRKGAWGDAGAALSCCWSL